MSDTDCVTAQAAISFEADAEFARTIRAYLDDHRLNVDLTARNIELGNNDLERVVVLRGSAHHQGVGSRVGGYSNFLFKFGTWTAGCRC